VTLRVLTAIEPRHEAAVMTRLGAIATIDVVRRCPDLPDLLAAGAAGLADVAVVSAGLRGLDRDSLAQLREADVHVIGLIGDDEAEERRLRQLGVATIVPADSGPEELREAIERLAASTPHTEIGDAEWAALESGLDPAGRPAEDDSEAPHDAAKGRVVAVWGPVGSPGRTTLSVNLAGELAATGVSVLLIDADTYGACVAQVLGLLDEAAGMAAAARAAEVGTLDLATLARLAPRVDPGFRVLTGLPSADRWPELRAESMTHLLDLARGLVDVVIVDCAFCLEDDETLSYDTRAPRRNGATLAAIAAADTVLAVGAGDPVGLQRLVRGLPELREHSGADPTVVVNRVRASVAGGSPERRIGEALDRFAGVSVEHFVPEDPVAFDRCLLSARLLLDEAPKSLARARVRALAATLPAMAEPAPSARRRIRPRSARIGRWSTA